MAISSVAGAAQSATQANTGVVTPTPLGIPKDLPNAGIYMQQQAQAELAWQQAQTQLLAQRNTQYHTYGLGAEGQVDPFNQYGRYQSLLSQHEAALHQADEGAQQRGLFGSGLGMQGERALRYVQGQEDLALQQDVGSIGQQYNLGIQEALASRNRDVLGAQLSALAGGGISGYGAGGAAGGGSGGFGTPWDDTIAQHIPSGGSFGQMANNGQPVNASSQSQLNTGGGWGVDWEGPGTYIAVKFRGPDGKANTKWIKVGDPGGGSGASSQAAPSTPNQSTAVQAAIAKLAATPLRSRPGME